MKVKYFLPLLLAFFLGTTLLSVSLSKDSDDEVIYTALAVKLKAGGMAGYNLRGASILPHGNYWQIKAETPGNLLASLARSGVDYYDVPLYFNPPFFPVLLSASLSVWPGKDPFLLLKYGRGLFFSFSQLGVVLPVTASAALLLLGIYFLAGGGDSRKAAWLPVFFCAMSPVFLAASFKTWSDLTAAAFLVWGVYFWRRGEKRAVPAIFLSAVLVGLAILTRTASLFILPIFLTRRWKDFGLWSGVVFLVCGFWFYQLYQQFGDPFYFPQALSQKEQVAWMREISRPWYFYLLDLFYLSPVFLLSFLAPRKDWCFYGLWFAGFLAPLSFLIYSSKPLGLEDRYLLSAYPALSLLAFKGYERARSFLPGTVLWGGVSLALLWSLKQSIGVVASRAALVFVPW